ncbi:Rho GTPase activator (Sac7), putative [Trichophyton verrucosum HKI 0517]|uniref:Rho GTPase activator (Sac7), putative n=1 Tax=Trichophyton verrucosum (strain HKI 0517) TaxID=663202 RepID=D4DJQ0_TRIVH|nr:Rho GTPase activator (Sac7), putative [Trichophyton verrucosum HKI 0517]EFE37928.1 Rho GTPase activator (Sac7), putative [Trichophyton verrucosum HKI 0517]
MAHSQSQSQSQAPQTSAQEASATSTPSPAASGLVNSSTAAHSPPSKRDLASWWRQFKRSTKKDAAPQAPPSGIFGIPLNVSIKYANVAISLTGDDGKSFIYGYVPIVVAKCGVFLKEKATDVEGIFRLSGSAKRIKDLQEIFNSPDRFGKGLDWTGYTVHDAANILRRYLNQLPEPIVPLEFYERFREPLRHRQGRPDGEEAAIQVDQEHGFDREAAVIAYQQLIKELPPLNRQLLLYILDLLTVFASKSDLNRMTAANLAAIFQPGMLSHPSHDMSPQDYKLSQDVLVFLIENQDNFLFGMTGTAADAQTVQNIQGGMYPPPLQKTTIRRSASNASGGADSLRKYEALRRNMSVSSRNSNGNVTGPSTPNSNSKGGGLQRSNTVPSKRAPGFSPSSTFARQQAATPPAAGLSAPPQLQMTPVVKGSPAQDITKVAEHPEPTTTTTEQPENGAPSTAEVVETAPATEAAAQISLPVRNIEAALPEEPAKTTTEPAQAQPVESTKSDHPAEPARAPQLAEPFEFTKPPEPAPSPAPAPAPASAPAPAPASTPPGPDSTTQPATAGQPAPVEQSQPAQSSSTAHPIPKAQRPNHIDAPPPPQLDPATHKPTTITPTRERKLASLFSWTSPPSGERRDANKLKKKRRIPGSASESAQSSTASLPHGSQTGSDEATPTKQQQQPSTSQPTTSSNPEDSTVADESHVSTPKVSNPPLSPLVPVRSASTTQSHTSLEVNSPPHHHTSLTDRMLRPRSRTPSPNSHSLSATDQSDLEESSRGDKKDKRRSWRFHLGKKSDD